MDIIMGGAVVLGGAVAIAVACMALWGLIRALGNGQFGVAVMLVAALCVGAYYAKQGYASFNDFYKANSMTLDFRSGERVVASEWNSDVRRLVGHRNVTVVRPDSRELTMLAQTIELRKQNDRLTSVWLCSDRLTSDDAAELIRDLARELNVTVDDLRSWQDRRQHSMERDPPGWAIEKRGHPYVKFTIDSDARGYWWAGVMYAP